MNKKWIGIIGVLFCVSSAWATLITDDFNRTAGYNSLGRLGTTVWTNGASHGQWGITNGSASANLSLANGVVFNTSAETISGNGSSFAFQADVEAKAHAVWGGVMFNYQNDGNYYVARYRSNIADSFQVTKYVDGVAIKLGASGTGTLLQDVVYTIAVTSSNAYEFTVNVYEAGNPANVLISNFIRTDAGGYNGGYAGFCQNSTGLDKFRFDNFSLNVIPEPATIGLFGASATILFLLRRRHI
ncbi:MAG: PEP-CTERM sorting domain-containing protein [Kiritimatiellales bacterium]